MSRFGRRAEMNKPCLGEKPDGAGRPRLRSGVAGLSKAKKHEFSEPPGALQGLVADHAVKQIQRLDAVGVQVAERCEALVGDSGVSDPDSEAVAGRATGGKHRPKGTRSSMS